MIIKTVLKLLFIGFKLCIYSRFFKCIIIILLFIYIYVQHVNFFA